ncbi:MAG: hypothetical protein J5859_03970, partial [Clostridia bacterium]|nr:hypothetical protein [Clostridia bacterium]
FTNTSVYQGYLYPDGSYDMGVFVYDRGEDAVQVNGSDRLCVLEDGSLTVEYSEGVYIRFVPGSIG